MNKRKAYPTDLTDAQWTILEPLIPEARPGGRKRTTDMREVLNAIFYLLRAGCAWRMLPHDFPAWQTVYKYFRRFKQDEVWQMLNDALREAVRLEVGRQAEPSVGLIDSQSVKGSSIAGERGVDGFKWVKGRKRHILTDTLGLLLVVVSHAANIPDKTGAWSVFKRAVVKGFTRLELILADGGYENDALTRWLAAAASWTFQLVTRPEGQKGFVVQAQRWCIV